MDILDTDRALCPVPQAKRLSIERDTRFLEEPVLCRTCDGCVERVVELDCFVDFPLARDGDQLVPEGLHRCLVVFRGTLGGHPRSLGLDEFSHLVQMAYLVECDVPDCGSLAG